MNDLWYAEILTWNGIVAGASHYLVTLHGPGRDIHVEQCIDTDTAERWNRRDPSYRWQEGDQARRFDTEELARKAAAAVFSRLADPAADLLVEGSRSEMVPLRGLAGAPAHLERIAEITLHANAIGWWDDDRGDEMDRLMHEWTVYQREHFREHPRQTRFGYGATDVIQESDEIAWGTPRDEPEPDYSIPLVVPPGWES